jgi:hypothetical protein
MLINNKTLNAKKKILDKRNFRSKLFENTLYHTQIERRYAFATGVIVTVKRFCVRWLETFFG